MNKLLISLITLVSLSYGSIGGTEIGGVEEINNNLLPPHVYTLNESSILITYISTLDIDPDILSSYWTNSGTKETDLLRTEDGLGVFISSPIGISGIKRVNIGIYKEALDFFISHHTEIDTSSINDYFKEIFE